MGVEVTVASPAQGEEKRPQMEWGTLLAHQKTREETQTKPPSATEA